MQYSCGAAYLAPRHTIRYRRLLLLLFLLAMGTALWVPSPFAAAAQDPAPIIIYLDADMEKPGLGAPDMLEMHLINVASADCILLRSGNETMLVDCGRYRNYERVVDHLNAIGITELTYAFASHPHDDHIGGFIGVLSEVSVGTFLQPRLYEDYQSERYAQLQATLVSQQIPVVFIDNDTVLPLGDAMLTFMQWQQPDTSENNRSMIVKVVKGERSALLTADIGRSAQKALAALYGDALQVDILKFPHHGLTEYRKELHAAVRPELATFSNTRNTIADVLNVTESRGVRWMLTTRGTIIAVTDGIVWNVWQLANE